MPPGLLTLALAAWWVLQAKLAAPLVSLLQTHNQAVDPNLVQLAEAWAQADAALKAQGKSTAALEAAAAAEGAGEEEEEEGLTEAAAGDAALPEDLQVGLVLVTWVGGVCGSAMWACLLCHTTTTSSSSSSRGSRGGGGANRGS
jgi:hypothetical protein